MDVGAVGGWDYVNYDYDHDSVYAIEVKGTGGQRKQRRKGQRRVLLLRINRAFLARAPPAVQGQGQRQSIQGERYNCGGVGHPAHEWPKRKGD